MPLTAVFRRRWESTGSFTRLALRLAGLRVHSVLRAGSPDRCAASPPGNSAALRYAPGGGARRALPGLRVHSVLRAGSPDRCAASPPGNSATLRYAPGGGARRALPGLRVHSGLRAGSPDRCAASPPGDDAALRPAPPSAARITRRQAAETTDFCSSHSRNTCKCRDSALSSCHVIMKRLPVRIGTSQGITISPLSRSC